MPTVRVSEFTWPCDPTSTPLESIRTVRETAPGKLQALGTCSACEREHWSRSVDKPEGWTGFATLE